LSSKLPSPQDQQALSEMSSYYRGRQPTSVGWKALLEWVNDLLKIDLTKVEQCASGAVYCQLLDICYPGTVDTSKVNWMAKAEHEYLPNYKTLQVACATNGVMKQIPVGELIRGKFRDNFEMLQWMKSLWDRIGTRKDYEPLKSREGKQLPPWAGGFALAMPRKASRSPSCQSLSRQRMLPTPCRTPAVAKVDTWRSAEPTSRPMSARSQGSRSTSQEPDLKQRLAEQEDEINLLRQEKDLYFDKLRNAELLCKRLETSDDAQVPAVVKELQAILYREIDEPVVVVTPEVA